MDKVSRISDDAPPWSELIGDWTEQGQTPGDGSWDVEVGGF